ncbi:MAG: phosphoribosyltransferase family protein [Candidatus Saccharibacteria bacterium]|nr:phosphoribosyltransferase family protein [Candidatus Saccharibacteria bacterium]
MCAICQKKHNLFTSLYCVGERCGSLKRLVGDYKYHSEIASYRPLAQLLADKVCPANDVVIVSIPTISAHIRERGFDHMLLVARELARLTGSSVNNKLLYRTDNLSQHTLKLVDRKKLIQKSLAIKTNCPIPDKVLLVDDIWTTGSTMMTAAKLLKMAGVSKIYGAVIARQPTGALNKKSLLLQELIK